jgi:hypothetical protein
MNLNGETSDDKKCFEKRPDLAAQAKKDLCKPWLHQLGIPIQSVVLNKPSMIPANAKRQQSLNGLRKMALKAIKERKEREMKGETKNQLEREKTNKKLAVVCNKNKLQKLGERDDERKTQIVNKKELQKGQKKKKQQTNKKLHVVSKKKLLQPKKETKDSKKLSALKCKNKPKTPKEDAEKLLDSRKHLLQQEKKKKQNKIITKTCNNSRKRNGGQTKREKIFAYPEQDMKINSAANNINQEEITQNRQAFATRIAQTIMEKVNNIIAPQIEEFLNNVPLLPYIPELSSSSESSSSSNSSTSSE